MASVVAVFPRLLLTLLVLCESQAWAQVEEPATTPKPAQAALSPLGAPHSQEAAPALTKLRLDPHRPWLVPKPPPKEKHYLRTAIEEALALAGGTTWYWLDRERQVADWDFPSLAERLTLDVIRYDNNPHHVNFAFHAANGMSFHFLARVNGLSFLESVATSALTSLTWEYALEYREKVSLNDLLFTTGAGVSLGEFVHVFGRYLNEDPEASAFAPARWTAGFPQALTRRLDGVATTTLASPDPHIWHDIHVAYAFSDAETDVDSLEGGHALHGLHFDAHLVRLPGYMETGVWGRYFHSAEFTESEMELVFGSKGNATRVFADTTLLGYYSQQIHADSNFISNAYMVGVSTAYRYRREEAGQWDERLGILHLPGLATDLHLRWRDFTFDASARLHLDFVGANALSNDAWEAAHPDEQGKSILRKQGYYYGYGKSAALAATIGYRGLKLGGSLWSAQYSSDEGLDRIQEEVTLDQRSSDALLYSNLWLRIEGLPYRSYLGAKFSHQKRSATLEEFDAKSKLSSFTLHLGLAL